MEPTFENLLKISLERQYQPSTFAKLYNDFQKKYSNSNNENIDISSLYIDIEKNYLQRDYVYEILVGSDINNTFKEFIFYFSFISNNISLKDQKFFCL